MRHSTMPGAGAKRYRAPTPMPAFRYKVKGGHRVVELYDECHRYWRAGVVGSWYFGKRSPADPTIVWQVDGRELAGDDLAGVASSLAALREAAGVRSVSWGETWCGYRAVVVTFVTGLEVVQSYDGRAVVEAASSSESAVA